MFIFRLTANRRAFNVPPMPNPNEEKWPGIYAYFKLAVYDPRLMTFRDGKETFRSGDAAVASVTVNGTYRVSGVRPDGLGRWDFEPFEVTDRAEPTAANRARPAGTRPVVRRPTPGPRRR